MAHKSHLDHNTNITFPRKLYMLPVPQKGGGDTWQKYTYSITKQCFVKTSAHKKIDSRGQGLQTQGLVKVKVNGNPNPSSTNYLAAV